MHLVVVDWVTAGDSLVFKHPPFFVVHGFYLKDLRIIAFSVMDYAVSMASDMAAESGKCPLLPGFRIYFGNAYARCFKVLNYNFF